MSQCQGCGCHELQNCDCTQAERMGIRRAPIEAATEEWVASSDDETYNAGPYESVDDALDRAPDDLGLVPGDRFFVGRRRPYAPTVDARALIDAVGERTFDDVGDEADEFLVGVSDAELAGLQNTVQIAFDAWLEHRGLRRSFWSVDSVKGCEYSSTDEGAFVVGN